MTNASAAIASWCWKPAIHAHTHGWTDTRTHSPKVHFKTCILVTWTSPVWESEKPTTGRNINKWHKCQECESEYPAATVFQLITTISGTECLTNNILYVALSLNRAWSGWTARAEGISLQKFRTVNLCQNQELQTMCTSFCVVLVFLC